MGRLPRTKKGVKNSGPRGYLIVIRAAPGKLDVRTYYRAPLSQAQAAKEVSATATRMREDGMDAIGFLAKRKLAANEIQEALQSDEGLAAHPDVFLMLAPQDKVDEVNQGSANGPPTAEA